MLQIKDEYDDMKKILRHAFKKREFSAAYNRLDKWLDSEIAKCSV